MSVKWGGRLSTLPFDREVGAGAWLGTAWYPQRLEKGGVGALHFVLYFVRMSAVHNSVAPRSCLKLNMFIYVIYTAVAIRTSYKYHSFWKCKDRLSIPVSPKTDLLYGHIVV